MTILATIGFLTIFGPLYFIAGCLTWRLGKRVKDTSGYYYSRLECMKNCHVVMWPLVLFVMYPLSSIYNSFPNFSPLDTKFAKFFTGDEEE